RAHGGQHGLRDPGLLESALARPRHAWVYREQELDLPALAAEYAFGLIKNHPFLDGNKRIGFVAANVFLMLNGLEIEVYEPGAVDAVLRVADGGLDKDGLAAWIRSSAQKFEG
ncbi:MAG TPA: type II toxin-antitoxin system death-on-curing family toxin, partial [Longimicrobiales bacterium]|nr:type II toxin-antitoxin system death-on-curing family toxin [Longimicrobiales bacterium]